MKYIVTESRGILDDWRVTSEETERGRVELAIFSGPNARDRAEEYAAWKNHDFEPREKIMPQKKAIGRQNIRPATKGKAEHTGSPGSDQDVKRRLGNFVGAGEHARKGGRTSGIVGQKTKKLRGD